MLNGILNNILNKVVKPETMSDNNKDNDTNKDNDKVKNTTKNINEVFKLPISYNSQVKKLGDTIITDLELLATTKTEDAKIEDDKPIYNYVFNPSNSLGNKVLDMLPTLYTTDTHFLKENQQLLESFSNKM